MPETVLAKQAQTSSRLSKEIITIKIEGILSWMPPCEIFTASRLLKCKVHRFRGEVRIDKLHLNYKNLLWTLKMMPRLKTHLAHKLHPLQSFNCAQTCKRIVSSLRRISAGFPRPTLSIHDSLRAGHKHPCPRSLLALNSPRYRFTNPKVIS